MPCSDPSCQAKISWKNHGARDQNESLSVTKKKCIKKHRQEYTIDLGETGTTGSSCLRQKQIANELPTYPSTREQEQLGRSMQELNILDG